MFADEGVEGRVLDSLRQVTVSQNMRLLSHFVCFVSVHLYLTFCCLFSVVIPAAQNVPSFSSKSSCGSVATFSLPAGITYPVQIPAGVTLQTASGHFYKVNVPVMVTRGSQHVLNPAAVARSSALTHLSDPAPAASVCETPLNRQSADGASLAASDAQSEFTLDGIEFSPQPADMSTPPAQALRSDYSRQQREQSTALPDLQTEALQTELKFKQLLDITQLDGVADSSSDTEEDGDDDDDLGLVGEKEFLGMINEEEELEEEEDPLNSGDDVSEQDIPEIFDTENVIVCQYDKIHRSKNRWKFYLKDGVMSYGGKDYVFSKAVGEAEW
uniref:General transcription factor IIA, 1-like n=1 Tax=Sinocyclocheilus grahami TaxID=75366 RepID=A0A672KUV5_SINGR